MNPIIPKANRGVFDIIENLAPDPNKVRPVTFWFYSISESNLYRAAARLQKAGYDINYCGPAAGVDEFLLIAEKLFVPELNNLNRLCQNFEKFAEQLGVKFDGWETMIDLNSEP